MDNKHITELILSKVDNLLLEARIDNIKKKFPLRTHSIIDDIADKYDPSGNNKYLDWLAKILLYPLSDIPTDYLNDEKNDVNNDYWSRRYAEYKIHDQNRKDLKDDVEYFNSYPRKFEQRDINQYSGWDELHKAVEKAKLKLSRKEIKESGVVKLFENDDFLLLTPLTHQAACRYGSGTRWCVAMRGYSGYFEQYFTQGPIFFLMDKRMIPPTKSMKTDDYYKLAMHYRPKWERSSGYPRFQTLRDDKQAFKLVNELSKPEFLSGADKSNAIIDFWTMTDRPVKKSVAQKYMGGPGRGQAVRGSEAMSKFENVMEKYTIKVLSDFYDSVDKEVSNKINSLKDEIKELKSKRTKVADKIDSIDNLLYHIEGLSSGWGELVNNFEELESTDYETFKDDMNKKLSKLRDIWTKLDNSIDEEEENLEDLKDKNQKFQFYDSEKSIPQN